jgi:transcription elongation factor GreA
LAEKKVMLTQEGYNKLVEKLNYLKSVRRIEVADRLKAAIALGDLSENSEYVDAKNEQAFLEGEIVDLEKQIRNSDIIHEEKSDVVALGSKVRVQFPEGRDLDGKTEDIYMIVGSTEADPDENRISDESPLGVALIGQKEGSAVQVHSPAGVLQYKIIEIVKD